VKIRKAAWHVKDILPRQKRLIKFIRYGSRARGVDAEDSVLDLVALVGDSLYRIPQYLEVSPNIEGYVEGRLTVSSGSFSSSRTIPNLYIPALRVLGPGQYKTVDRKDRYSYSSIAYKQALARKLCQHRAYIELIIPDSIFM
jgi:predicted nucleotidyltransferase